MSHFPILRTGAVAQYPAERRIRFATDVVHFIDGAEQRSRSFAEKLRRWVVRLDLVGEGELAEVEAFFTDLHGQLGTFAFTDPWDGTVCADCSLDTDEFVLRLEGPGAGKTQIVIRENRS